MRPATAEPLAIAASSLAFFCSLLTFSRGLMVGLLASLALYAWISRVPLKRVAVAAGAAVVLFGVLALAAAEFSVVIEDREIEVAEIVESRLSDVTVTRGWRDTSKPRD